MKIKLPKLQSREEFLAAVDEAARLDVEIRSLQVACDARLQQVQDEFSRAIEGPKAWLGAVFAQAEKFAEQHQCELMLGKARSAQTALARYGFRTGMPQLKLKAKMTWEKVLAAILKVPALDCFIRPKPEIDKAEIIAQAKEGALFVPVKMKNGDEARLRVELSQIGVHVVQEETFYIEPKLDDAGQLKSPAAK